MSTSTTPRSHSTVLSTLERVIEHAIEGRDTAVSPDESLQLALLFAGERPAVNVATLVPSLSAVEETAIHELVESLPLPVSTTITANRGVRMGDGDVAHLAPDGFSLYHIGYTVVRDVADYRRWKQQRTVTYHESLGTLLGYPQDAIDWWVDARGTDPNFTVRRYCSELLWDERLSMDDLKRLELVPYVPPPNEGAVKKAVEVGWRYEAALRWFSEEFEMPSVSDALEATLNNPLVEEMADEETNPYV